MVVPGPGELFEREYDIAGVRIVLLAEFEPAGALVHLKDVAVYARDSPQATVGVAPLVAILRHNLMPELAALGFETLRITGRRLSGAAPGRIVDRTFDLSEQP